MPAISEFIKSNKLLLTIFIFSLFTTAIMFYGHTQKQLGAQTVIGAVNAATVKAVVKNDKINNAAVVQANKDVHANVTANQAADAKQNAAEIVIRKKYVTKRVVQVSKEGVVTTTMVPVPAPDDTMPNDMEKEISDSRIDDTWSRYCYFKQQDNQQCEL